MKYKVSEKALEDIETIWFYTMEQWSVNQADRYCNLIFEEIEHLTKYPLSGKDYGHIRKNYRRSKIKSHFIFYRYNQNDSFIEIIRILHQNMDIEERFNE